MDHTQWINLLLTPIRIELLKSTELKSFGTTQSFPPHWVYSGTKIRFSHHSESNVTVINGKRKENVVLKKENIHLKMYRNFIQKVDLKLYKIFY